MERGRRQLLTWAYVGLLLAAIGVRLFSQQPFPDNEPYPAFLYPSFAVAKNPDGEFRMPVQSMWLIGATGDSTEVDLRLLFDAKAFNSALVGIVDRLIDNMNKARTNDPDRLEEFKRWVLSNIEGFHDIPKAGKVVVVYDYIPHRQNGREVGQRTPLKRAEIELP